MKKGLFVLFAYTLSCGGGMEPDIIFKRFMKAKKESRYTVAETTIDKCVELNSGVSRGRCDLRNCMTSPIVMEGLKKILEDVGGALGKVMGKRYFLEGGTLIGAYRFQAHMPWDDDVDVGVIREEFMDKLPEFRKEIEALGYKGILQHSLPTFTSEGAYMVFFSESGFKSLAHTVAKKHGFEISQDEAHAMWVENLQYGEPYPRIDIIFFDHDKVNKKISFINPLFPYSFDETDVFTNDPEGDKQAELKLLGVSYPVPHGIDNYLKLQYKTDNIKKDWVMGSEHNPKCRTSVRYKDINDADGEVIKKLTHTYLTDLWKDQVEFDEDIKLATP